MPKTKVKNVVIQQLSLLDSLPAIVEYKLEIEPVPKHLTPGRGERFAIVSKRFKDGVEVVRYQIPGLWTGREVSMLQLEIYGVGWQLLDDPIFDNRPRDNEIIHEICRIFCRMHGDRFLKEADAECSAADRAVSRRFSQAMRKSEYYESD